MYLRNFQHIWKMINSVFLIHIESQMDYNHKIFSKIELLPITIQISKSRVKNCT